MAWIESHQSLSTHRKTMALESLLGIETPTAVGHLHLLWWWALDNVPSGDLTDIPDAVIARAAQWRGDAGKFVLALISSHFIDESPRQLHDWNDYAGKLMERREANRLRVQRSRNANVMRMCIVRKGATVPNPTVPNSTIPKENIEKKPYGEFQNVFLTDDEYLKLQTRFNSNLPALVEELSTGIASKGYKYKSHYATILSWVAKKEREARSNGTNTSRIKTDGSITGPQRTIGSLMRESDI